MKVFVFPGQGSQRRGMGEGLFDEFSEYTAIADEILEYSIKTLCLEDPDRQLNNTQFTQAALYTVNALHYIRKIKEDADLPDYLAGHSLGEYNALLAAGAYDFATGLKLVKNRGELMSRALAGRMMAVIGIDISMVNEILKDNNLINIDVANYNNPTQTILSGPEEDIINSEKCFTKFNARCSILNVRSPFHSRYMKTAAEEFEVYLKTFSYSPLKIPVIANIHARPYQDDMVVNNLKEQIYSSVQWTASIRYLMGKGKFDFEELGPGKVLTKLVNNIIETTELLIAEEEVVSQQDSVPPQAQAEEKEITVIVDSITEDDNSPKAENTARVFQAEDLGSTDFKQDYNIRYAYLSGSMYKGIGSKEIVVKMAKAGFMGFLGAGGLTLETVEQAICYIQGELTDGQPYGINLLHHPGQLQVEMATVDLLLKYGVKTVEASAFIYVTPALVKYKLTGLKRDTNGEVYCGHRIIAKLSRPEVVEAFLRPAPEKMVNQLLEDGQVTAEQAELARHIPLANDICAEADSGGHTDSAVAWVIVPTIARLRDRLCKQYHYSKPVRVGAAGGLGTPEAIAAAFVLGADFVLTGSINQCTVESGNSDKVKDLLQQVNIQDTDYAPAGDMFEIGAKVQVMKKGVFFPARANKLYDLWRMHDSWEEVDEKNRQQIEKKYFYRSFDEVYDETRAYYNRFAPAEIEKAERIPKHKMALVFRWYFIHTSRLALAGDDQQVVDYQVHTGPAMGAFNQWVKGTELENWRNRHVDEIGKRLMVEAAEVLQNRF